MKELSIEEKAKAYDNIIEKANKMHSENCEACQICIEELIPELQESEDERIRKGLIKALSSIGKRNWGGIDVFESISWLEKQGEQKPIKEHNACEFCEDRYGCVSPCSMKLIEEEKPVDKVEQKPAWSEEDDKMCQETIDWFEKKCFPYALESENPARESIKWLKSLKDRVQPKQEWSKEDEEMMSSTVFYLNEFKEGYQEGAQKCISWLKSIKDGMQPKPEWSEEDKKMLDRLLKHFEWTGKYRFDKKDCDEARNWLKSLRPQNRWKPSDEQMEALHYVTNFDYGGHKATLVSLYEQLKKLRGE